jgi:hypothetical protein
MISKGLIVIPTQGFGNRIKIIASAHIYCRYINLPLYICWDSSEECSIPYSDIFSENNTLQTITMEEIQASQYCYFGRVHTNSIFDKIDQVLQDKDHTYDYILIEGGHEFKLPAITRLQYLGKKRSFYQSLEFVPNIQERIDTFISDNPELFSENAKRIGIHYRDIKTPFDGLDVENNPIVDFVKNSPLDAFYSAIQSVRSCEHTHFIVISNSDEIYNHIVKQFPDRSIITTTPKSYHRNDKDGMLDAIVDFLILTKCNLIIGSYFSSFSDEASSFKLIPKITPLSKERIENIQDTVQQYHCLNYSYIDNIASLHYNDQIFLDLLELK